MEFQECSSLLYSKKVGFSESVMLHGKDFSLAQTLAQTGFFSLWHGPASVAPGRAGFFSLWHGPASVAPGRAGFFSLWHGPASVAPLAQTGFALRQHFRFAVAPLAQTGFALHQHFRFAVAPGRAGRALRPPGRRPPPGRRLEMTSCGDFLRDHLPWEIGGRYHLTGKG